MPVDRVCLFVQTPAGSAIDIIKEIQHPHKHTTGLVLGGKCPAFQLGPFASLEDTIPCKDVSFPRLWRMASAVTQARIWVGIGVPAMACLGGLDRDGKGVSGEGRWPWSAPPPLCGIGQVLVLPSEGGSECVSWGCLRETGVHQQ